MWNITKIHKHYGEISILFLHRDIILVHFTCIKSLWWLFTVRNMNDIHPFSFEISLQHLQNLWNNEHTCYILLSSTTIIFCHRAKIGFTSTKPPLHLTPVSHMNKNQSGSMHYGNKMSKLEKKIHNYHIWGQSQNLFSSPHCTYSLYQI